MARPATAAVRLLTGEREPVRLATTANIDVDTGGLLTIDGVQTEVGDRILLTGQTDGSENGIRTASAGQWFRAADARTARAMQKGTTVTVQEGTYADRTFRFNTLDPVIGDTDLEIDPDPIPLTPANAPLSPLDFGCTLDVRTVRRDSACSSTPWWRRAGPESCPRARSRWPPRSPRTSAPRRCPQRARRGYVCPSVHGC
ncbi:hypothetical protein AJ88_38460 [Mesorhizobium amorphae CCBAU 01583]|nr:hypothetical protein AJ88_38460 [Mesorhizobium amorphae CCBAU 01583]